MLRVAIFFDSRFSLPL